MKLFGVGNKKNTTEQFVTKPVSDPLVSLEEREEYHQPTRETFHTIDVHIDDTRAHEDDIGQIALDIFETNSDIVIIAPVAGIDPDEIDISIARNILTISGNRLHPPIYLDARKTLVDECFYGAFSRSVILPENLAFNKIHATAEHNSVQIFIPKLRFSSHTIRIGKGSDEEEKKEKESEDENV